MRMRMHIRARKAARVANLGSPPPPPPKKNHYHCPACWRAHMKNVTNTKIGRTK